MVGREPKRKKEKEQKEIEDGIVRWLAKTVLIDKDEVRNVIKKKSSKKKKKGSPSPSYSDSSADSDSDSDSSRESSSSSSDDKKKTKTKKENSPNNKPSAPAESKSR